MIHKLTSEPIKPVKLSLDSQEKLWMIVHVLWTNYDKPFYQGTWSKCTSGHIVKNKWFRDKGLSRHKVSYPSAEPIYKNYIGFDALQKFFNINNDTLSSIFGTRIYIYSASEAAERLQKWLLKCEKLKALE